ncbi:MAG TPA: L,D-transpeptidase family protein [Gammaproteobacteria bacterium]
MMTRSSLTDMRGALLWLVCTLCCATSSAETFLLPQPGNDIVGKIRSVDSRYEDTLLDIARRFDLGYNEITAANAGVDPWLPGEEMPLLLPTQFILPAGPREGIVLNVAAMRLFYFPKPRQGQAPTVITYPVGIGRQNWRTPLGVTRIVAKVVDPVWYVPKSIRAERAQTGELMPEKIPPGPDNPLGKFALPLAQSGYLIHGTNKPWGVGRRVSHGCVRLYPEDIEKLFNEVPVGTPVRIVNQPYLAGWLDGVLYLQAYPPLEEERILWGGSLTPMTSVVASKAQQFTGMVDWDKAVEVAKEQQGLPVPILATGQETR